VKPAKDRRKCSEHERKITLTAGTKKGGAGCEITLSLHYTRFQYFFNGKFNVLSLNRISGDWQLKGQHDGYRYSDTVWQSYVK
jgi:hypothetical protein